MSTRREVDGVQRRVPVTLGRQRSWTRGVLGYLDFRDRFAVDLVEDFLPTELTLSSGGVVLVDGVPLNVEVDGLSFEAEVASWE